MKLSRSALSLFLLLHPAHGLIDPDLAGTVAEKTYEDAALKASNVASFRRGDDLPDAAAVARVKNLEGKFHQPGMVADARSGRVASFHPDVAIMPGKGRGNRLLWHVHAGAHDEHGRALQKGRHGPPDKGKAAVQAVKSWMLDNASDLDVDVANELFASGTARFAAHGDGNTVQIHGQRTFKGLRVVDSYAAATVKKGNLISVAFDKWATIPSSFSAEPAISSDEAKDALADHAGKKLAGQDETCKPELVILTLADVGDGGDKPRDWPEDMPGGGFGGGRGKGGRGRNQKLKNPRNLRGLQSKEEGGYTPVLAWRVCPKFEGQKLEEMSGYVRADDRSGNVFQFVDEVDYFEAKGDVYPLSNDEEQEDGVLQEEWPMPFMTIGGETSTTGGVFSGGGAASYLGPYVRMSDNCGTASLSASGGLDWGGSEGTDCDTPGFGGAGNTHSSRSGFYELNKLIEIAQSHLPDNNWLQQRMTSVMNIDDSCNAFFSPSDGTINFFKSSNQCGNTGELAAVFDHEWGHGMDWNDVAGGIAQPSGEGIADIYSALRLNDSCIGRGFFKNGYCNSGNNACKPEFGCSGVRDIDYTKKQRGTPDNLQWALDNCGTSVHCLGHVYAGAIWNLFTVELRLPQYGMDENTALELTQRLTYLAAGTVSMWYTKSSSAVPWGGCGANSGYKAYLNADDDDGNLANGTPHMQAIYNAFNRFQIACNDITVQDSGCAGTGSLAQPDVTLSAGNNKIDISWTTGAAGTTYQVFRTEGLYQCKRGKVLLATTQGSAYTDTGLQNGREYSYIVIPKGEADPTSSCFGPSSDCASAIPLSGPDLVLACPPDLVTSSLDDAPNNIAVDCTISALGGFTGTVEFTCASGLPGVSCTNPTSVELTAGQTQRTVPLTIKVSLSAEVGDGNVSFSASSGQIQTSSSVPVTLFQGGGAQLAQYSSLWTAPFCLATGNECSTVSDDQTTHLVKGRGNLGPEANAANTIDSCTDGNSGSYLGDESLEWIKVSVDTGSDMKEGDTVTVEAGAWCWSTGTSDSFDMYYTTTPSTPSWTPIAVNIQCPGGGFQSVSATYTIPTGQADGLNAVRVQLRYSGSAGSCSSGSYNDRDDLVFTVELEGQNPPATPAPQTPAPTPNPTAPPTPNPTAPPTPSPTDPPTPSPTDPPTPSPTDPPTPSPTNPPTPSPTNPPTPSPTNPPTPNPTAPPTPNPTAPPTPNPTDPPTPNPTAPPTPNPTDPPTPNPTDPPTPNPTDPPTPNPTDPPTPSPTNPPTPSPTNPPTNPPIPAPQTPAPTKEPTPAPTPGPTPDDGTTAPTYFTCSKFGEQQCPHAYGGGQCQWLGPCHNCGCKPVFRNAGE